MRKIPFSRPSIGNEEKNRVIQVLDSGWITTGPVAVEFEKNFAEKMEVGRAVAVNSCTAALHLSLVAMGIKEGDEVITSPFTFTSTANVCLHVGAKPIFADIDPESYCIDPKKIEKAITSKTKAIIPVHYGGQACDMDEIMAIAKKHNLKVIEDCAHAPCGKYKGKNLGTIGDAGCFSFYPIKNMTTGEGGMVITNNSELADLISILRLHGISKDAWKRYNDTGSWYYEVLYAGFKQNMTELQAALGVEQLKKLDGFNKRRREIAEYYNDKLGGVKGLILPKDKGLGYHVYHLYPVRVDESVCGISREGVIKKLNEEGIGTSVHFIPLNLQPLYGGMGYKEGDFPVTEGVYKGLISLPIYPLLTEEDLDYVAETLKRILKNGNQ
ncbi:MAG: DegT/DnrJ/EryC1/StrS aminotransferase family protein [Nanoarchaeota archaeon]|nr:DegT/DnrJ/EryC1/StrS aminotransferase family protein [Nanoarchaeota archaeon]MBU0977070.1 DegT/DnrJ/EryC1/StrS aminotransferase family protein [Nanoarchaeota archaeon]